MTAIAYGQKIGYTLMILVICNCSCIYKRQKITSKLYWHPSSYCLGKGNGVGCNLTRMSVYIVINKYRE